MRRSPFVLVIVLFAALSLVAQESEPVSYLAAFQVNPGKESDFVNLVKKYDKPMLDGLMAEGSVLAWGLDAVMIHREGGITHLFWFVTPDYAGLDKVFAGFEKMEESIPEEEQARFRETVNFAKHHDHILRSLIVNVSEAPPTAPPYTNYASVKVKPGKGREWRKLFEKYSKPVLDKLVADGDIYGYGVDVEDFHTEAPQWRWIWVVTTNMAAFDKIDAAFEADRQGRSEEERQTIRHRFRSVTEAGTHRDYLLRSIVMPGGEGEE